MTICDGTRGSWNLNFGHKQVLNGIFNCLKGNICIWLIFLKLSKLNHVKNMPYFAGPVRAQEGGREVNKLTANEKFGPDFAHVWVAHGGVIHKEKKLVEKLVEMEF